MWKLFSLEKKVPSTSDNPDPLSQSWNSFSEKRAREYLKTFGHPSLASKKMLAELLRKEGNGTALSIVDLGCGNAQLYEFLKKEKVPCTYTGVDFSETLLAVARHNHPKATFILDDVNQLKKVTGTYDVAVYSHTIEMLSSPESSLLHARTIAKKIIIRFFEPPVFEVDTVDLKMMETAEGVSVPYLRRKMSRDYYYMILAKMKCQKHEVYSVKNSKDEIHVITC